MFRRAVRLRQAEEALKRGFWEEALRLASDPRIAEHRRAREVRRKAREALLDRARHRLERGNLAGAARDLGRAGGDATLAEDLKAAGEQLRSQVERGRYAGERARFFLSAGLPRRALEEAGGEEAGWAEALRARAGKALERGERKAGEVRNFLEEGNLLAAAAAWRELLGLDREKALEEPLLRAFLRALSAGEEEGAGILGALAGLDPLLLEEAASRGLLDPLLSRALEEAGRLLGGGRFREALAILERLEPLPLPASLEASFLELLCWARGLDAASAGKAEEAAGRIGEGAPSRRGARAWLEEEGWKEGEGPEAGRWLSRLLPASPGSGDPLAEGALTSRTEEIARSLAREALEASEESLQEGFRLLEEGLPRKAAKAFLEVVSSSEKREEGLADAFGRIGMALWKMGAFASALAGAADSAGLARCRSLLEEASGLDREVPGLEKAREELAAASAFLEGMEGIPEGAGIGVSVKRMGGSFPLPRRSAPALFRAGADRLRELCRKALREGAAPGEVRLLGAAREGWGLPADPAFPVRPGSAEPGGGEGRGNPMEGFYLRVAGRGDLLVLPRERLVLGSAAGGKADLPVLARLGSEEVEFTRSLSFHRGLSFRFRSLSGAPLDAGGEERDRGELEDGMVLAVGPALKVRFRRPGSRTATALLEFPGDFDVEGCRRVAWMKVPGWDGALLIGPDEDAHIRIPGAGERVELALDDRGRFLLRASENIETDWGDLGAEGILDGFGKVRAGGILLFLDPRSPGPAEGE